MEERKIMVIDWTKEGEIKVNIISICGKSKWPV